MSSLNADFYSEQELSKMHFRAIGTEVLISRSATLVGTEYMSLGSHVRIDPHCVITAGKPGIMFGNYVHIGANVVIIGGAGVIVSDFVTISHQCTLLSKTDDFSGHYLVGATVPNQSRNVTGNPIICAKFSFVGVNSVIFPGVTLNEGVCVGASSLVKHSLDAWKIYVGTPARYLRDRSKDIMRISPE